MATTYDAVVLGVGGFGSGALCHLARRGARVLGIERFGIAHSRGSSHGQTRIIRKAYFEHPDYVPLLHAAYDLWRDLERQTGRSLLHQVGLFVAGKPESESVRGTLLAAETHHLPITRLSSREASSRFPGFRFPEEFAVVYEEQAGYLDVEQCVTAHVESALRHGAELVTGETVLGLSTDGSGVRVQTDQASYLAGRLVVTAGPWASQALAALEADSPPRTSAAPWTEWLRVVRKPVFWFPAGGDHDVSSGSSTFFFETDAGQFYGFPRLDGATIKVAEHTLGDPVADPLTVDRALQATDLARLSDFLEGFLPAVAREPAGHSVCMYTRSPDGHFLVDRHPHHAAVILAMGFSGHGFKFTSVLGQALADLALDGATSLPIDFLRLERLRP